MMSILFIIIEIIKYIIPDEIVDDYTLTPKSSTSLEFYPSNEYIVKWAVEWEESTSKTIPEKIVEENPTATSTIKEKR